MKKKKKAKERNAYGWLISALGILLLGVCFLFARVFLSNDSNKAFARNTLGKQPISAIAPYKGYVYDRKMRPLAASVVSYSVYAHPLEIKNPAEIASLLSNYIKINSPNLIKSLGSDAGFVWIARRIKSAEAEKIRSLNLKGIYFARENSRVYPYGSLASQTLGFTDLSGHGVDGLESAYESVLSASTVTVRNNDGTLSVSLPGRPVEPEVQAANNLILTLDTDIQSMAEKQLTLLAGELKGKSGSMIVLDLKTGAILALANYPGYNPNTFWESDAACRKNNAISDLHEMGNLINFFETVARMETEWALAQNTAQSAAAADSEQDTLKITDLYNSILRLGVGRKCSRDLPGESKGDIQPLQRYTANNGSALFTGRNIYITPLQLITAFSTVVNKGSMPSPFIISKVTNGQGQAAYEAKPANNAQICRTEISEKMRAWLSTDYKTKRRSSIIQFSTCNNLKPAISCSSVEQALDKPPSLDYIKYLLTAAPITQPDIAVLTIMQGTAASDLLSEDDLNVRSKYITYEALRLSRNNTPARGKGGLPEKNWEAQADAKPLKPVLSGLTELSVMPDLRGKSMREALCCLQKHNVSVAINGTGVAVNQSPAPGTRLGKATRCFIQFKPI